MTQVDTSTVAPAEQTPTSPASPPASASDKGLSATSAAELPSANDATVTGSTTPPTWTKHYDTLKTKLPASISSHIPSSTEAAATVDQLSERISTLTATSTTQLGELQRSGSKRIDKMKESNAMLAARKRLSPDQFLTQAYSIRNDTQIAVNVSLNQVGPLMYAVVAPNETFERRVPNVWYSIELRPYTSADTAYTNWSVSWPIIAVSGPIVAATSLLLVPVVALMAGGTALASLTGIGASVTEGVAAATAGAGSAAATAGGLVSKLAYLPGGSKIKGKLVDAAKENMGKGKEVITERVVRYLGKGTAVAAIGGALGEKEGANVEEERGRQKSREKEKKKLDEVEVTGLPLEKVLKCETGKKRTDRSLSDAFKRLNVKVKEFKSKNKPVLRIVGGPELDERGKHSYLVFYPFHLEPIIDFEVEAIPTEELPPTPSEAALLRDAVAVESVAEAEEVAKRAPPYSEGDEKKRVEVEEVVNEIEAKKGKPTEGGSWFGWGK
ncbi:hypothetical protein P7C70_g3667, partial [Phenoliferia sp. Uapishka_3]